MYAAFAMAIYLEVLVYRQIEIKEACLPAHDRREVVVGYFRLSCGLKTINLIV